MFINMNVILYVSEMFLSEQMKLKSLTGDPY